MKPKIDFDKCMMCKTKNSIMQSFTCSSHVCESCLDDLKEKSVKMFQCKNCNKKHYVNKRKTGYILVKMPKDYNHKDEPKRLNKASRESKRNSIRPFKVNFKSFDYSKFKTKSKKIEPIKKFNLNETFINDNSDNSIVSYPIQNDKILIRKGKKYIVINQENEIIKQGEFKQPGDVLFICMNSKYIYVLSYFREKFNDNDSSESESDDYNDESNSDIISNLFDNRHKSCLYQYSNDFEFIDEILLSQPCYSIACNDKKIFFSTTVGTKANPHPSILIYNSETLEYIDIISNEYEDIEDKYICEDLSEPPSLSIYQNKLYIIYPDVDSNNKQQLDIIDNNSYKLKKKLNMPAWFFYYRIDKSNGNMINYDIDKDLLCIYKDDSNKPISKLSFSEKIDKEKPFTFCISNDGHLITVRDDKILEIY